MHSYTVSLCVGVGHWMKSPHAKSAFSIHTLVPVQLIKSDILGPRKDVIQQTFLFHQKPVKTHRDSSALDPV